MKLCKIQELVIASIGKDGAFLNKSGESLEQSAWLKKDEITEAMREGDRINVFVYYDDKMNLIASLKKPKITTEEIALLEVVDTIDKGAFLDWGMEQDLFIPKIFQTEAMEVGRLYWVALRAQEDRRPVATMEIYKWLSEDSGLELNDEAEAVIYEVNPEMGIFVAVNKKFHGLIPKHEIIGDEAIGDVVQVRVTKVREDGRLNVSMRKKSHEVMDDDAAYIYQQLDMNDGFMPYNDKSAPDDVKKVFKMSKRAFKRGIGRLYKDKKIDIKDDGIHQL